MATIQTTPLTQEQRRSITPGAKARLGHGGQESRWWTVRAADERFAILTRQAPFKSKGESEYTIIDWARDLRGPCNLIGQGWEVDKPGGCESLLRALNYHLEVAARLDAGEGSVSLTEHSVEVSYRDNVPIDIREIKPRDQGPACDEISKQIVEDKPDLEHDSDRDLAQIDDYAERGVSE